MTREDPFNRRMDMCFGLISKLSKSHYVATIYVRAPRQKHYTPLDRQTFPSSLLAREWFDREWPGLQFVVVSNDMTS